jgi:hypothetical protein
MKGTDAPLFVEAFLDVIEPLCSNFRQFFAIPSNSGFNSDVLGLMTTLCLVVKEVKISGTLLVRCVAMLQALLETGKIAGEQSARYLDFGPLISAVESTGNATWETLQGLMTLMTLLMKYLPESDANDEITFAIWNTVQTIGTKSQRSAEIANVIISVANWEFRNAEDILPPSSSPLASEHVNEFFDTSSTEFFNQDRMDLNAKRTSPPQEVLKSAFMAKIFNVSWRYILSLFSINERILQEFGVRMVAALRENSNAISQLFLIAVLVSVRPEVAGHMLASVTDPAALFINDDAFSTESIAGTGKQVFAELHQLTRTLISHFFIIDQINICTQFLDELRWSLIDASFIHIDAVMSLLEMLAHDSLRNFAEAAMGSMIISKLVILDLIFKRRILEKDEKLQAQKAARARIFGFICSVMEYQRFSIFFFGTNLGIRYMTQLLFEKQPQARVLDIFDEQMKYEASPLIIDTFRDIVRKLPQTDDTFDLINRFIKMLEGAFTQVSHIAGRALVNSHMLSALQLSCLAFVKNPNFSTRARGMAKSVFKMILSFVR